MTSNANDDHDDFGGLARDLPGLLSRRSVLALLAGGGLAATRGLWVGRRHGIVHPAVSRLAGHHGRHDVDNRRSRLGGDDRGSGHDRRRGDDRR